MKHEFSAHRRRILQRSLIGTAGIAVLGLVPGSRVWGAEDLPKVSLDDPTAKQLKYVHDADANAVAKRSSGEYCHNCRYYKGDESDDWARCDIFPGKLVNGQGWCNVYAAK
ncbi:MAG: high-potential iron-sulfur protein [Halofilum sp. (in: g-proteobacteria)]|nr:high-potential iron-sulfur protein [Halofilum sp. (in: g-proteobacteria)]